MWCDLQAKSLYDLINIGILNEIKLSILPIMNNSNVQESCKLFLIMKFIFHKEMNLQSFKFLNIVLAKNENNIINIEEDDDLAVSKTARFIENGCKT